MVHLLLFIIYMAFISLGLPDGLLGAAWPSMQPNLDVPFSYAGIITMIICCCTIISSLLTVHLVRKLGTGKLVFFSVLLTALALLGFSLSHKFYLLCILAVPYGLGAGAIDASLNNYVATHFKAKHMSWLHCMWGIGATLGPYAMSYALTNNHPWNDGYLYISIIQFVLVFFLFLSLPLWKSKEVINEEEDTGKSNVSYKDIFKTKGVFIVIIMFFCYCSLEQTTMLWASSYLVQNNNVDEGVAAFFASMFFLGITSGRFINGFLAMKLKDRHLIRMGYSIIILGIVLLFLNIHLVVSCIGFALIGLGCAPIYPSTIHSIPLYFGKEKSQLLIGIQMAGAYLGTLLMPPFFGLIAQFISIKILPIYLSCLLLIIIIAHEFLITIIKKERNLSLE